MGKPVILGRKTFETLNSPLAGRTNIVLTRDKKYCADGVQIAEDLESAISIAEAQCALDGQNEIITSFINQKPKTKRYSLIFNSCRCEVRWGHVFPRN